MLIGDAMVDRHFTILMYVAEHAMTADLCQSRKSSNSITSVEVMT